MVKHRKRSFNLRKVRVASSVAAGALAAGDVIAQSVTNVAADKMRFISVSAVYSLSNIGASVDDGIEFGIAHSDYTAAEIEECLEAGGSMDLGDKIAREQANRLVRIIGNFGAGGGSVTDAGDTFNDGMPVKTKLNWLMSAGDTLVYFIRNTSDVIYTAGTDLTVNGILWVKD